MIGTRLRIAIDGSVRALWTDEVDFAALGRSTVRRASHVEFDVRRQLWTVREAVPPERVRRWVQRLWGRPCGCVLCSATTRREALAWERDYFGPGGAGWIAGQMSARPGLVSAILYRARLYWVGKSGGKPKRERI